MGWYANTQWELTFKDAPAVAACAAELKEHGLPSETYGSPHESDRFDRTVLKSVAADVDAILDTLHDFNESGEYEASAEDDGTIQVSGYGGDKANDIGRDPNPQTHTRDDGSSYEYNSGGEGVYAILARHCTGVVYWDDCSENQWLVRFKDGGWSSHDGEVIYPTDPGA